MAIIQRAKSSIKGLTTDLQTLTDSIASEVAARGAADGNLTALTTTAKTDLVSAINEVLTVAEANVAPEGVLLAINNLNDVADVAVARTNLAVMSADEVGTAIDLAKLAVGTNHAVADIGERDALTNLSLADRVFVADDGDAKWAMYVPTDVTEGAYQWVKIYDQDALENSIDAPGIKAAYESNANTNAFTDAEKTKLSTAIVVADLAAEVGEGSLTEAASTQAVKAYVDAIPAPESVGVNSESLVVAGSTITLAKPVASVSSVLNFGCVRYTDSDGVSFDAPVIATATPGEFTISTDSAEQWDGFTVQIQYLA